MYLFSKYLCLASSTRREATEISREDQITGIITNTNNNNNTNTKAVAHILVIRG